MSLAPPFTVATTALGPISGLIVTGHLLRRADFPSSAGSQKAERHTHYVLLPALLVKELVAADPGAAIIGPIAAVIVASQLPMTALTLLLLAPRGPA